MPERPLFIRNVEGSRVYYDVLSSKRSFYYTVDMLDLLATGCDCDNHVKGHKHCNHMTDAESAEAAFQQTQHNLSELPVSDEVKRHEAPLNGTRAFSLLR